MSDQKFHKGDLVMITSEMPEFMSHFTAGVQAIVIGSYDDKYGGDYDDEDDGGEPKYDLYIKGEGAVSWYPESTLTLIETRRVDLLKQWRQEDRAK